MFPYLYGIFSLANIFIAIFITTYAYLFLFKTDRLRDRRPWDLLFVASLLFLTFEVLAFLEYLGAIQFVGVDIAMISVVFEFLYSSLVLLAFISQHELILKSHLIFISRKKRKELKTPQKEKETPFLKKKSL